MKLAEPSKAEIETTATTAFGFNFEDLFKLGQEVMDEGTSEEYNIYGDSDNEEKFAQRREEAQKIIAQEKERMEGGLLGRMRKGVTAGGARERAARRKGKKGEAKDVSPAPKSKAAEPAPAAATSVSPRRTTPPQPVSVFGFNFELPELLAFGQAFVYQSGGGEKQQAFGCPLAESVGLAMADLSDELIPAGPWKSDRHVEEPGLSKLSEREDHSSQKHVEFPDCLEENQAIFLEENHRSPKGFFASSFGSLRGPESRWNADDQAFARLAFIFFVVHLAGGLVLIAFYYNFAAFEVYIMSLFWAMIVSIPLYQVKMTIMRFIFSRLLRQTFVVLEVSDEHPHHHRYKVLIRKLPWFYWLYTEKLAETEEPVDSGQNSEDHDDQPSEPATVEAFVDKEASEHLRKGLAEGKVYHAAIVASGSHPQQIEAHWEKRHWLGPLRPYASFMDIFRDLYNLYEGTEAFIVFMLKPFHQFSHQDDKVPLSAPYFGLLLRLCALQLLGKLWSRELQMKLMILACYTYLLVVSVRLAAWTIGVLTPIIWSKIPLSLREASRQLRLLLKRMLTGAVSKWRKKLLDKAVQSFEENCHFLLSMLIIMAAMLLTVNFMSFLVISLRHEAEVIHSTCYGLLQKQEAYQSVMARLTRASDGDLFATLLAKLEETLPDYELMLAKHIPDFYILKYVMYDLWTDEHSAHSMSDASHHQGTSPEMAKACEEAVAHGASCNAEETIVMKHALRNTTALLRGLAAGNLTDIASLLSGAYAEISSISSWFKDDATQSSTAEALKDGAAHGATLLARLTYFLPRVFLDMLSSASSALGQTIVFMTALFYLLSAEESCLAVVGEFLRVVDQNQVIFAITEKVMRAVLVSAMKMSAFHALFTWLLYSFGQLPIVVVPTVLSAILALVPKVSPVWSISVWAAGYLWLHNQRICAALYFFVNLAVWWQVPTVIYAEIPEANAWLTGLGVVLGVGQFGLAGVVLGPLLASVPLICYNLVKLFNTLQWHQATESSIKRPSLFNLHKDFLPNASPRGRAASMRSDRSSSSETELLQPEASARLSSPPTSPTSRARRSPDSPERCTPEPQSEAPGTNGSRTIAVRRRNRMP
eukprot:s136_g25.t1